MTTNTHTKSERERQIEESLRTLEKAGGKGFAEEDVIFQGRKLIIPANLTLPEAIRFLMQKEQEDEQETAFTRTFKFRPWDGANALANGIRSTFGMMGQKSIQTFFGENPPSLVTIKTDVNEEVQVPWGAITIPSMPGLTIYTSGERDPELGTLFTINAVGPRKYRFMVEGLFNVVQKELEENSIYRGKAFDGRDMPEFLDLSNVDPSKVVYSQDVLDHLNANVWSLLRHTEAMKANGVSLKRSVLFEGPYGTGKTLGAYLTAKEARENGWTFIYVRPGRDNFEDALATARLYQPAVVFMEDVDTFGSPDDGEDYVSRLLDAFDGIQSKGTQIVAILTTNHVEAIHKGMLRPGRLDAIISIGALDQEGVRRLIEVSLPEGRLDVDVNWDAVYEAMADFMPAFVREAVDRAVRYTMARNEGQVTTITTEDLVNGANGLRPQLDLMNDAPEFANQESIGVAFRNVVKDVIASTKVEGFDYALLPDTVG